MRRLYVLFALSGAAGLIYEVVWFQLLRLTIGANSGSLGITLACFMGGLFIGSFGYTRWIPKRWNPLRTYALMEVAIGAMGLLLPALLSGIRDSYLSQAHDPGTAFVLRSIISAVLLMPPTILMGATLPALSRWVKADDRQVTSIGRLYASNIIGAVLGAFGAAFLLMPHLGFLKTNWTAVILNVCVAALTWTIRDRYRAPVTGVQPAFTEDISNPIPVYLAYALNGATALAFEVLWSRILGIVFGATVYAFAIVLGVFLLALGLGGAFGTLLIKRVKDTRKAFAFLQVGIAAAVSSTGFLVPFMAFQFAGFDTQSYGNPSLFHLLCLIRAAAVAFPGAFLWGMSFPLALACLERNHVDPAKPVGYLYAYNTVGSVIGSLGSSFLLLPLFGSTIATAHLIILPLMAAAVLYFPGTWPRWSGFAATAAALSVAFLTPAPSIVSRYVSEFFASGFISSGSVVVLVMAVIGGLIYKLRWKSLAPCLAVGAIVQASLNPVPPQLFMLGYDFAHNDVLRNIAEIKVFQEGSVESVVVFKNPVFNNLSVSINGRTCASSVPEDMQTQILLGLIPVLFSSNAHNAVVIGLGAGITAGSVSLSDAVQKEYIVELEPKVVNSAIAFAQYNHDVLSNPKVHLVIDDGRHFIASSREKFGVITSDPIDPYMAGAAALYTAEHFKECRNHLIDGGVFMQWLGMYQMDKDQVKSILAAFAEAFPDGDIWLTPADALLVGSTRKMTFDVETLRKRITAEPKVTVELSDAYLPHIEDLLAQLLCSCESIKEFLKGTTVNRDGNLHVQFGGVHRSPWIHAELFEMMWSLRKWDPERFILPEGKRADFMKAIASHEAVMAKTANWKIGQYGDYLSKKQ